MESFNTVNGRYCCNLLVVTPMHSVLLFQYRKRQVLLQLYHHVSIIDHIYLHGFNTVNGRYCCNQDMPDFTTILVSFNTVNGRYCCNGKEKNNLFKRQNGFNTVNGRYCCNFDVYNKICADLSSFNTVNGRYCCNLTSAVDEQAKELQFQYRKRQVLLQLHINYRQN